MAYIRDDYRSKTAYDVDSKLWDLRIRLSDFIGRFLDVYRNRANHGIDLDPFTVFFLQPCFSEDIQGGRI